MRQRTDNRTPSRLPSDKTFNFGELAVLLKNFQKSLVPFALLLTLVSCDKQGPLERAGEEIEEAVEDARAGGETTGNKIDDTIDEVVDAADDVRKDLK